MRSLSILRRFGGVDIKLKTRERKRRELAGTIKLIFVIGIGIYICCKLFTLFDEVFNGTFVDWFTANYMYETQISNSYISYQPKWSEIKIGILFFMIFSIVFWFCIISLMMRLAAKRREKEVIFQLSDMIHMYISKEQEPSEELVQRYSSIAVQIVEMKSAMRRNEQLAKEEAARKNDLITYLAHDLKTPLTSVIGYLSLLTEAPDMPQQQRERYASVALDKAYRLENLINEFFEITRYNLQHVELEKESIDLYYMLVQMTDEFYPMLSSHGNTISLQIDENLTIVGDAMKLARVFNNIIKNAIAYSYEKTAIEIMAEIENGMVSIYFKNRGKTIPPQKIEALFEKFFRLDEARNTNTGGAGLGLAIARDIVALHGGGITVESKDEVTVFVVKLPQT